MAEALIQDLDGWIKYKGIFSPYYMAPEQGENTGLCLVFNNIHFTDRRLRTRLGSSLDYRRIDSSFSRFGFKVEEKQDASAAEMMDSLWCTAKAYSDKYHAFVCFFLSHGREEKVVDRDGQLVDMNELVKTFVDHCPQHMIGKPKLFFSQMCRGEESGEEDREATAPAAASNESSNCVGIAVYPETRDVLLAFATTSGRVAYRSDQTGSPYIHQLTQVLKARGHKDELFEVLMVTRRLVEEIVAMENKDMCPSYVSTLTRPLVFSLCAPQDVTQETREEEEAPSLCSICVRLR